MKLSSGTNGSLNLTDIFDADELESKVNAGLERVEDNQQKLDEWWDGLRPGSSLPGGQENPINKAKYALANKGLESAANVLVAVGDPDASVQYSLDKKPKNMWNFIVGSQFQLNKSWMIRGEVGFLGARTQVITGLQYRFGL
ncbi:MAG: hypothetical protein JEZ14_23005 [Marinilabiliaceae bacterium]|nr:hypothetical protein [Marinilabiliaceae bacterium]